MKMRVLVWLGSAALGVALHAQQTGTVVGRTPGSALGQRLPAATEVPRPAASCGSPAAPHIPTPGLAEMVFSRMMDDLICLRHPDGRSELLLRGGPWTALSPDGNDVAYWLPEKHELHVFSIADRRDNIVDTIPGANMRQMAWAARGRVLAYALRDANQTGVHVVDLDTGKRAHLQKTFGEITASPDPTYAVTTTDKGVLRVRIADGRSEIVAAVPYAADAAYSASGALLGILASDIKDEPSAATEDEPDCTGALFALWVKSGAAKPMKVPFPKGFEGVLDFAFAPDDRAIAVTFGAAACDYPGDVARVYLVSLPGMTLKPLSPADRLSVKAHWSPDGKMVIYSDYAPGGYGLVAVDIATGKRTRLTSAGDDGPDELLGWRRRR